MSVHKLKSERKNKAFIFKVKNLSQQAQQQLQEEIDTLALLLNEVKKQIEKIEAAADAIGDAMLFHSEESTGGEQADMRYRRGLLQMPKLSRSRNAAVARSHQEFQA